MCFIDDILVTGNTERDHLKTLEEVLQRLNKHNVRLNKTKCQFLKSEVTYLGHPVSANGIQPIQNKVEATRKAPPPTNLTELQSFLGAVQYYAKFVPNLSTVLHLLHDRLKAGVELSWGRCLWTQNGYTVYGGSTSATLGIGTIWVPVQHQVHFFKGKR